MRTRRLVLVAALLTGACRGEPPANAPAGPVAPYPDEPPPDLAPELGWRWGGCPFERAAGFGDLATTGPIGPVRGATLACRVESLRPGRAVDYSVIDQDGDGDVPDLIVGARFGAGPVLVRHGPDDAPAAWVVLAPVTLAAGDLIAFAAKDHDSLSQNDVLGAAFATYQPDAPLALRSDDLAVACAVVPPDRVEGALGEALGPAEPLLAAFEQATPRWDPPRHGEPEAAYDARLALACAASLAGPDAPRVARGLARLAAARARWDAAVRALVQAQLVGATRPGEAAPLEGTGLTLAATAQRCGERRIPDDDAWGMPSRSEAAPGHAWCLIDLRVAGASPLTIDLLTSPTRDEHDGVVGFLDWTALTPSGRSATCHVRHGAARPVPAGGVLDAALACDHLDGEAAFTAVRVDVRVGPGDRRRPVTLLL